MCSCTRRKEEYTPNEQYSIYTLHIRLNLGDFEFFCCDLQYYILHVPFADTKPEVYPWTKPDDMCRPRQTTRHKRRRGIMKKNRPLRYIHTYTYTHIPERDPRPLSKGK